MEQITDKRQKLNDDENGEKEQDKPFFITRIRERRARKFNVEEVTFRAKFNESYQGKKLLNVTDQLHDMFDEIMENVKSNHNNQSDKARLSIRHSGLEKDVHIHCQPQHNITGAVIMER